MMKLFGTSCAVRRCKSCSLVYKDRHPGERGFKAIYSAEYSHFHDQAGPGAAEINSAEHKFRLCLEALSPRTRKAAELRVLDVGCGAGGFVKIARTLGYQAEGVDPYLPASCEEPFLRRGELHDLPQHQYDILFLLNVIEHVTAPRELLASAKRLLRPGGVIFINCPYGGSLALKAYRQRWTHLALDEHLLFWTCKSLDRLLSELDFGPRIRCRIAGSPFPFGRANSDGEAQGNAGASTVPSATTPPPTIHGALWRLARSVQTSKPGSWAARAVIDALMLGDYLECVARVRDQ
jgi:SAM-dependent methyltransferase